MTRRPRDLRLAIDHLVVHGISELDRGKVAAALEAELGRLFEEQGPPAGLERETGRLELGGGSFATPAGLGTRALGRHIARAVYDTCASAPEKAAGRPAAGGRLDANGGDRRS